MTNSHAMRPTAICDPIILDGFGASLATATGPEVTYLDAAAFRFISEKRDA
jgi:hypothetical protein